MADLIEKGDIGQIKDAMDQSLSPGSQSFETALVQLVQSGQVAQDEALANADSATNLLWLLNNGPDSKTRDTAAPKIEDPTATSFTEFTLNS